jgi:hypothetical protein
MMSSETPFDPAALREEVKSKYREVALNPHGGGSAMTRLQLMPCRMLPLNHLPV